MNTRGLGRLFRPNWEGSPSRRRIKVVRLAAGLGTYGAVRDGPVKKAQYRAAVEVCIRTVGRIVKRTRNDHKLLIATWNRFENLPRPPCRGDPILAAGYQQHGHCDPVGERHNGQQVGPQGNSATEMVNKADRTSCAGNRRQEKEDAQQEVRLGVVEIVLTDVLRKVSACHEGAVTDDRRNVGRFRGSYQ